MFEVEYRLEGERGPPAVDHMADVAPDAAADLPHPVQVGHGIAEDLRDHPQEPAVARPQVRMRPVPETADQAVDEAVAVDDRHRGVGPHVKLVDDGQSQDARIGVGVRDDGGKLTGQDASEQGALAPNGGARGQLERRAVPVDDLHNEDVRLDAAEPGKIHAQMAAQYPQQLHQRRRRLGNLGLRPERRGGGRADRHPYHLLSWCSLGFSAHTLVGTDICYRFVIDIGLFVTDIGLFVHDIDLFVTDIDLFVTNLRHCREIHPLSPVCLPSRPLALRVVVDAGSGRMPVRRARMLGGEAVPRGGHRGRDRRVDRCRARAAVGRARGAPL